MIILQITILSMSDFKDKTGKQVIPLVNDIIDTFIQSLNEIVQNNNYSKENLKQIAVFDTLSRFICSFASDDKINEIEATIYIIYMTIDSNDYEFLENELRTQPDYPCDKFLKVKNIITRMLWDINYNVKTKTRICRKEDFQYNNVIYSIYENVLLAYRYFVEGKY